MVCLGRAGNKNNQTTGTQYGKSAPFGPIFCVGSKFVQMSAQQVSFVCLMECTCGV